MRIFNKYLPDHKVFDEIRKNAEKGFFDGRTKSVYFESCRYVLEKYECILIYTKDINHHAGGWWKNPDYERCYHMSISFPGGMKKKYVRTIVNFLFGWDKKNIWIEPPFSEQGKKAGVWHYRLFCDENWKAIKPRREVYSKHFTKVGWKSYSELHGL